MRKFFCILILTVTFIQYYPSSVSTTAEVPLTNKEVTSGFLQRKIIILRSVTTLKRGDAGIITIQGEPGALYNVQSSFKIGNRTIPVNQWRTGDSQGIATFNWVVGLDTVPGTYPVTISGGGEELNITHTVLP